MIFETSQDTIELSDETVPLNRKHIGIKLSGGADSAIIAYMLALYCKTHRPDITLHAITGQSEGKPFNVQFAKKIVDKIEELLDYKCFGEHYITAVPTDSSPTYVEAQVKFVESLYEDGKIDMHFAGMTANPPPDTAPEFYDGRADLPSDNRTPTGTKKSQWHKKGGRSYWPLINIDKRGVADLYNQLGVTDTLFPVTRSCESFDPVDTEDFTIHCEECWYCRERKWGFGRIV